eukprot:5803131-Amphidinium_carterae.1
MSVIAAWRNYMAMVAHATACQPQPMGGDAADAAMENDAQKIPHKNIPANGMIFTRILTNEHKPEERD